MKRRRIKKNSLLVITDETDTGCDEVPFGLAQLPEEIRISIVKFTCTDDNQYYWPVNLLLTCHTFVRLVYLIAVPCVVVMHKSIDIMRNLYTENTCVVGMDQSRYEEALQKFQKRFLVLLTTIPAEAPPSLDGTILGQCKLNPTYNMDFLRLYIAYHMFCFLVRFKLNVEPHWPCFRPRFETTLTHIYVHDPKTSPRIVHTLMDYITMQSRVVENAGVYQRGFMFIEIPFIRNEVYRQGAILEGLKNLSTLDASVIRISIENDTSLKSSVDLLFTIWQKTGEMVSHRRPLIEQTHEKDIVMKSYNTKEPDNPHYWRYDHILSKDCSPHLIGLYTNMYRIIRPGFTQTQAQRLTDANMFIFAKTKAYEEVSKIRKWLDRPGLT